MADSHTLMRSGTPVVLGVGALVFSVVAVASYSAAAPYVGFLDLARMALPGLALGAGAVAVALVGRGGLGAPLLTTTAIAASAPQLAVGLQQRAGAWVLVAAAVSLLPALLVTLALAFPDGRLRGLHRFVVMVVLGVGLVTALALAATYDPATWEWCRCVANPVGAGEEPDTYLGLVQAGTIGRMSVLVTGLACLLVPWQHRRGLPLAFDATFAVGATAWLASDALDLLGAPVPAALALVRETALVLLPVVYAMGFAAQRPSRAHVADLLLAAREEHKPSRLRDLVARAIGDPRAEVAWWDSASDGFRDHLGRPVGVPEGDALPVEAGGRRIAVVLSDRLRELDPGVRDSVAEALLLSSENRRLTAELQASLEQVRDSRARILTASDDTRRRIERDLHDGAQQLLISTGIKLNLAATEAARGDTETLARVLEDAQAELNRALTELRHLARRDRSHRTRARQPGQRAPGAGHALACRRPRAGDR